MVLTWKINSLLAVLFSTQNQTFRLDSNGREANMWQSSFRCNLASKETALWKSPFNSVSEEADMWQLSFICN